MRPIALQPDRLADQPDSLLMLLELVGQQPKQMQRLGFGRVDGEDPAIRGFGFGEAGGTMALGTILQQFGLGPSGPWRFKRLGHLA